MKNLKVFLADDVLLFSSLACCWLFYHHLTSIGSTKTAMDYIILITLEVILSLFVVFRYKKTCKIHNDGLKILAKINIIRHSVLSHFYVEITYHVHGESISTKQDLTRFEINKDRTAQLVVNPNNFKDFRVLTADDPLDPFEAR
jgi:hypothetical protein